MVRTQIYLTEKEKVALRRLARESGRRQSDLIREAIDLLVQQKKPAYRQAILDRTAGMWRGRDDLPDFRALRAEWDRKARR